MAPRPLPAWLRGALLCALAGTVVLAPGRARSDSVADTDTATRGKLKALYKSGKAHYNLGEFQEALDDFKAAYRLTPDPVFLFNIAQTQRELGDHEAALRSFQLYVREVRAPRDRVDAERLIAQEERILAARRAAAAAAAAAPAQVASQAPAPGEGPARGDPAMAAAAAPVPKAAAPSSAEEGRSRRGTFIALGVTGGLLLAGGAVVLGVLLTRPEAPEAPFGTYTAEFR